VRAGAALLLVGCLASAAAGTDPAATLDRIRDASTIELTTIGRKSGKEHMRPIWFVVDGGKVFVQSGKDGKTDWYQNVQKSPAVTLREGGETFHARARPVTDAKEVERIHALFLAKYPSARMLSWIGSSIGRGRPVELTVESAG
jgi:deazaflavin-dependent oxidoreductase (nitroreductase family)